MAFQTAASPQTPHVPSDVKSATDGFAWELRTETIRLGILYWSAAFVTGSLMWWVVGVDPVESAVSRLSVFAISALITVGIMIPLAKMRSANFAQKAISCFLLSILAGPVFGVASFYGYVLCQWPKPVTFDWTDFGLDFTYGTSLFFGWSCLFVALLYSLEVRDRERRLAATREEALSAQMNALRYQVNPHFLFNTLNSIAGLIEEGATTRAESMVLSLSTLMRTTLALDAFQDQTLGEELDLYRDYLEIEQERFPDRLIYAFDVPQDLNRALIPSLILQPLVENAVKHGVGRSRTAAHIRIAAARKGTRLAIEIENAVDAQAARSRAGFGIGLKNVEERLRTRFGDEARFEAGLHGDGRFIVTLELPYRARLNEGKVDLPEKALVA